MPHTPEKHPVDTPPHSDMSEISLDHRAKASREAAYVILTYSPPERIWGASRTAWALDVGPTPTSNRWYERAEGACSPRPGGITFIEAAR